MPLVTFDTLPGDARCWVFAVAEPLAPAGAAQLLAATDDWLAQWRAHGQPLAAGRDWRDARFLAVAVDERAAGASGCSVDALFRTLRGLDGAIGAPLVGGDRVFWRAADGTIQSASRAEFAAALGRGALAADTPVFDTTLTTVEGWRSGFERPLADSWHARLAPRVPAG
jgi:hypothetical protein